MTGLAFTAPPASPRPRTAIVRFLHEQAGRQRFVWACTVYARRQGLRPIATEPAGQDQPEETWIHGVLGMHRRRLVGSLLLVAVGALVIALLRTTPWVGLLVAAVLVGLLLALAWRSRRPVVAIVHASSRPLSARRLVALCHELQSHTEPLDLWVFSRGELDLTTLEVARARGVRCFERNGHGFDEHPLRFARRTRPALLWPRPSNGARPAA